MDDFAYGPPGRRGPQLSLNPKLLMLVGALLAAGLAVFVFLSFVSKGGEEIAESQATVVQQVDTSEDVAAQASLTNALAAAKTQAMDTGTYQGMTAADLADLEPSLTYTGGPSPDISTISVFVQGSQIGLAALSPSGTCFYVKDDVMNGPRYGSGTTCTGKAALSAVAPSW